MMTQTEQRKTATTTIRTGDLLVHTTVTTNVESVHVDFDDILAAVEVSPDDSMGGETPWDWCNGYVHTVKMASLFDEGRGTIDRRRGYCYSDSFRDRIVITAQWDDDLYRWYRDNGASKQTTTTLDDSHSTLEVAIPKGTREDQVEVTAQLCDARGEPDEQMEPIVLKAVSEAPAKKDPPKPKPADKPAEKKADSPKSEVPQP